MRRTVRDQLPLVPASLDHEHARELEAVRAILDAHPEFAKWVQSDLLAGGIDPDLGREGMSGDHVLRVSPPASVGTSSTGITGDQGPTRWRADGSSRPPSTLAAEVGVVLAPRSLDGERSHLGLRLP